MIWRSVRFSFILMMGAFSSVQPVVENEFTFVYNNSSPDSIELTVVYDGYRIEAIKYGHYLEYMIIQHYDYNGAPLRIFMIRNLSPCTLYTFDAKVKNLVTNQYFQHVKNIMTIPPDMVLQTQPDLESIHVELNYAHQACFDSVNIQVDNSRVVLYTQANLSSWLTIDHLSPCTNYNLVIYIKQKSESYKIYNKSVTTRSIQFRKVESINYDSATTSLKWPNFLGDCALKYLIIVTLESNQSAFEPLIRESVENEYNLDFLEACSKYLITVTSENHRESSINISIATENKEPGPITNLNVALINNTLLINWSPPIKNPACTVSYNVLIDKKSQVNTTIHNHTMFDVKPCKLYNLSVCQATFSPTYCVHFTFDPSKYEVIEIQNVTNISVSTNYNDKVTTITWNVSNLEKHCVKYYDARLYDELEQLRDQESVNSSIVSFVALVACQNYRLEIETFSYQQPQNKIESNFEFAIKPTTPEAPLPPELILKTSTSLSLATKYVNPYDKCKTEMFQISCDGGGKMVRSIYDEEGHGTFYNLKSFTYYDCRAFVKSEMGWSSPSNATNFLVERSRQYELVQMYLHSVSSKTIGVSWSTHLYVKWFLNIIKVETNENKPKHCDFVKYNFSIAITDNNTQSYKFENLEPNTNYSISLESDANNPNYVQQMFVITDPDVPLHVTNLKISHSSKDSITVTWQLPCKLNGRIKMFVGKFVEINPYDLADSFYDWTLLYIDEMKDMDIFNYTENRIKPEHNYSISVAIKLINFVGPLNESKIEFITSGESPELHLFIDWGTIILVVATSLIIFLIVIGLGFWRCSKGK